MAMERLVQRFGAVPPAGDAGQIVVGETDKRRLQRRCDREVVLRQERRPPGGDEVGDGDVLADIETVGAGDRHAGALKRADHGLERRAALAHQHQDVAGAPDAAGLVALARPIANRLGDPRGEEDRWRVPLRLVDRERPRLRLPFFPRLHGRPQLDAAGRVGPSALVGRADRRIFEGQAPEMERLGERPVDRREHRLRGTKGERQPHVLEAQRGALGPCLPIPAALLEFARRGALEAEDRLLRIADREDGSDLPRSRAAAGREILGDVAQDLPLLGVRVLRLVDEHVVDATVELVQHPGAVATREQRQRLGDEIVEIERADPLLVGLDPLHDPGGERIEGVRALDRVGGLELRANRGDALALLGERVPVSAEERLSSRAAPAASRRRLR